MSSLLRVKILSRLLLLVRRLRRLHLSKEEANRHLLQLEEIINSDEGTDSRVSYRASKEAKKSPSLDSRTIGPYPTSSMKKLECKRGKLLPLGFMDPDTFMKLRFHFILLIIDFHKGVVKVMDSKRKEYADGRTWLSSFRGEKHIQSNTLSAHANTHAAEIATDVFLAPIFKRDHRIDLARHAIDVTMTPDNSIIMHVSCSPRPSSIPCSSTPPRIINVNMVDEHHSTKDAPPSSRCSQNDAPRGRTTQEAPSSSDPRDPDLGFPPEQHE
ncbi:hypothetical protein QYE76_025617 [Lolium multiflorum]|uniref:Uncharacterized protein n=1 Tax=Lolium multiflorum TaxID=4521 RepID=A0AAD8RES0_LOLMU|nr:hypothetical protein QYE76_025617 [Lolium multiflorum]